MAAPRTTTAPFGLGGLYAVLAAAAFGTTTPLIQRFGHGAGPIPTATLLYAGAAFASLGVFNRSDRREAPIRRDHVGRLVAIALIGAVVAPAFLAWGLQHATGTGASLLLNFEAVFTVLFAWILFREPVGLRVAFALAFMLAGGAWLIRGNVGVGKSGWGELAVIVATLAWALDNTLTRPLADLNPSQVVRWKGALGAFLGLGLSFALKQPFPKLGGIVALLACGATGYGLSLRFYLLAQRRIGAGRTGSIFALAPFVGAAAAWIMGDRTLGFTAVVAACLFGLGAYLHLTEAHRHRHKHEPIEHEHVHSHDDGHHDHAHESPVVGEHSHPHHHDDRAHDHPHAPDMHHQHGHGHGA